jgi:hypothetical protein
MAGRLALEPTCLSSEWHLKRLLEHLLMGRDPTQKRLRIS